MLTVENKELLKDVFVVERRIHVKLLTSNSTKSPNPSTESMWTRVCPIVNSSRLLTTFTFRPIAAVKILSIAAGSSTAVTQKSETLGPSSSGRR